MKYEEFVQIIANHLQISEDGAEKFIATAPFRYKHYQIPKKTGGERDIHHPSPALKSAQRLVFQQLLKDLPIHQSAQAYVVGKGIRTNAEKHISSNFFTRMDFSDFFPSISGEILKSYFLNFGAPYFNCDEKTLRSIIRICCRANGPGKNLTLSIGAPSSPFISNAIMYEFDSASSSVADRLLCQYTRYADDIFLSSQHEDKIRKAETMIRLLISENYRFLRINEKKVQHFSRKRRVTITGVNISTKRELSVGRKNYRAIKTKLHLAISGKLPGDEHASLRGLIAHSISIDPSIKRRLIEKFGANEYERFMTAP